jgi:Domain of unknown function (DUF4177)
MSALDFDRRYRPSEEPDAEDRPLAVVQAPAPVPKGRRFQYLSGTVAGNRLETILNEYGEEGWRLRFCVQHKTAAASLEATFVVILERELGPDGSDTPAP